MSIHVYLQMFECSYLVCTNMYKYSDVQQICLYLCMYIDLSVAVYSYLFVCGRQYFKQNEMFNQFPKSQNRKDEDEKKNIKKFKPVGLLLVRQTHRLFSLIW